MVKQKGEMPTNRTCHGGVELRLVPVLQTTECMVRITVAFAENVQWQLIVFDEHSQKATPSKHGAGFWRFTYR